MWLDGSRLAGREFERKKFHGKRLDGSLPKSPKERVEDLRILALELLAEVLDVFRRLVEENLIETILRLLGMLIDQAENLVSRFSGVAPEFEAAGLRE